jgi:hypothetical protein
MEKIKKKSVFLIVFYVLMSMFSIGFIFATEENSSYYDLISGSEMKTKTIGEIAEVYEIDPNNYAQALSKLYHIKIEPNDEFQLVHDNYGVEPSVAKDVALYLKEGKSINDIKIEEKDKKEGKEYGLVTLFVIFLVTYLITKILALKKKITPLTFKKIWNLILLILFIICGVSGILLVLKEEMGIVVPLPFNLVFVHVQAGILMVFAGFAHIIERWWFFKSYFNFKKSN